MTFNPRNPIIQLCMQGMNLEDSGNFDEALTIFIQAWEQASGDYERFIAAYHLGLRQHDVSAKLSWMEKALAFAQKINDDGVKSAYPTLYSNIARYYEELNNLEKAKENDQLAENYRGNPTDSAPFYHGTKANLDTGDLLTAGKNSNYETNLKMNHIYFTANVNGAGLAASLAAGHDKERVYRVEPTGEFENDPNVTDKKFPGNLTRSYRSVQPLRILSEISDWSQLTPAERQDWADKLAKNEGKIIN